ncbi:MULTISPECIES: menaquinone biosynthesis family protein [unclassified Aureispira]|uniref:menaquinone biosynthesis family protein n=1 Tax=unclassified Aureispira TaxID=2649989 RepID=UPI0006989636|nr:MULTISPECIES: 1,4-dihydroxy-6-naphthoate synthase [unclassified Aureispira]WMX13533.1 1,4-dihydroxy-6-naphthoate synthase [Aureispira sp. CCB-E]
MKLTLGYSPCPNDTFIFDAMIHQRIDTEGLEFEVQLGDVEQLNQKAFANELNITKLSYHAYAYLIDSYALLTSGSALGNNCGPLLIAKTSISKDDLSHKKIAIPGKYTTANFLLSLAFPQAKNKQETLFSNIEQQVINGQVDAGLIIHENRFTYQDKGLVKLVDLGEWWEQTTQLPIPLGGIVVQRQLPLKLQQKINRVLRRSIEYAFQHPTKSEPYIRQHAQEMDLNVIRQHIDLYVNDFSIDLGSKGKAAIEYLFDTAVQVGLIKAPTADIFVE